MQHKNHSVDLCVVGGGMAGLCAAVAAARHGIKVALMQEPSRPRRQRIERNPHLDYRGDGRRKKRPRGRPA